MHTSMRVCGKEYKYVRFVVLSHIYKSNTLWWVKQKFLLHILNFYDIEASVCVEWALSLDFKWKLFEAMKCMDFTYGFKSCSCHGWFEWQPRMMIKKQYSRGMLFAFKNVDWLKSQCDTIALHGIGWKLKHVRTPTKPNRKMGQVLLIVTVYWNVSHAKMRSVKCITWKDAVGELLLRSKIYILTPFS